jgi:hypothetical protein
MDNKLEIFCIAALSILLIVGVVLWVVYDKKLHDCEKSESPLCLTGTCPNTTDACGNNPFKVDANGNLTCKGAITSGENKIPLVNLNANQ